MQIDMLLSEAFPREPCLLLLVYHLTLLYCIAHAHSSLSLPYLAAVSTEPIIFSSVDSLDVVAAKLYHFIDSSDLSVEEKVRVKDVIESTTLPFLKFQIPSSGKSTVKPLSSLAPMLVKWTDASKTLISALPAEQLFPVVDLWRIGFISTPVGVWVSGELASAPGITSSIIDEFLRKTEPKPLPRSFIRTLLKCLSNAFGVSSLSRRLLTPGPLRDKLTDLAISQLLEEQTQIRTAAASLLFNIASCVQTQRGEMGEDDSIPQFHAGLDAEWEVEVVSAVIEGIRREESEEIRKFSADSKSRPVKVVQSIGWLPVSGSSFDCLQHMRASFRNCWKYLKFGNCWRRKHPLWRRRQTLFACYLRLV